MIFVKRAKKLPLRYCWANKGPSCKGLIIFKNYINIINLLQNQNIIVYIQSTLECSRYYCGDNIETVRALNNKLKVYADAQKITYININEALTSEKDGLLSDYTNDGTHLLDKGYLIWSKTIKPYINSN